MGPKQIHQAPAQSNWASQNDRGPHYSFEFFQSAIANPPSPYTQSAVLPSGTTRRNPLPPSQTRTAEAMASPARTQCRSIPTYSPQGWWWVMGPQNCPQLRCQPWKGSSAPGKTVGAVGVALRAVQLSEPPVTPAAAFFAQLNVHPSAAAPVTLQVLAAFAANSHRIAGLGGWAALVHPSSGAFAGQTAEGAPPSSVGFARQTAATAPPSSAGFAELAVAVALPPLEVFAARPAAMTHPGKTAFSVPVAAIGHPSPGRSALPVAGVSHPRRAVSALPALPMVELGAWVEAVEGASAAPTVAPVAGDFAADVLGLGATPVVLHALMSILSAWSPVHGVEAVVLIEGWKTGALADWALLGAALVHPGALMAFPFVFVALAATATAAAAAAPVVVGGAVFAGVLSLAMCLAATAVVEVAPALAAKLEIPAVAAVAAVAAAAVAAVAAAAAAAAVAAAAAAAIADGAV